MTKEEEQQAALDRIKESTKVINSASELLEEQMKHVDNCFNFLVDSAEPQDKAQATQTVIKVNALIAKLKQGGDVNDIVKQIKDLA